MDVNAISLPNPLALEADELLFNADLASSREARAGSDKVIADNENEPDEASSARSQASYALAPETEARIKEFTGPGVRPLSDRRSAQEIIAQHPLLANLSEIHKRSLEGVIPNWRSDADAAYLATRVMNQIERYNNKGKDRSNDKNFGNGKIDGFESNRVYKPGTEADRLAHFFSAALHRFGARTRPPTPAPSPVAATICAARWMRPHVELPRPLTGQPTTR